MLSKRQVSRSERADFPNSRKLKGGDFRYQNLNSNYPNYFKKKMNWQTVFTVRIFLLIISIVIIIPIGILFWSIDIKWLSVLFFFLALVLIIVGSLGKMFLRRIS